MSASQALASETRAEDLHSYAPISVEPVTPVIGAEVSGLDRGPLDGELFDVLG